MTGLRFLTTPFPEQLRREHNFTRPSPKSIATYLTMISITIISQTFFLKFLTLCPRYCLFSFSWSCHLLFSGERNVLTGLYKVASFWELGSHCACQLDHSFCIIINLQGLRRTQLFGIPAVAIFIGELRFVKIGYRHHLMKEKLTISSDRDYAREAHQWRCTAK